MQELLPLEKKKQINYLDLDETALGKLPKIEDDVAARLIYTISKVDNEVYVKRGIQINQTHDMFEKEFYSEFSEMVEETYENKAIMSEEQFEDQIEISAHEGFHYLKMEEDLNLKYNANEKSESSELDKNEEGYAMLFGKIMKYVSSILESEHPDTVLEAYDTAFELAKLEISETKYALENGKLTNSVNYQKYILPAYEIANSDRYENLAPFAESYLNSIMYNFPEKYQNQELNFFECRKTNYQSCCPK